MILKLAVSRSRPPVPYGANLLVLCTLPLCEQFDENLLVCLERFRRHGVLKTVQLFLRHPVHGVVDKRKLWMCSRSCWLVVIDAMPMRPSCICSEMGHISAVNLQSEKDKLITNLRKIRGEIFRTSASVTTGRSRFRLNSWCAFHCYFPPGRVWSIARSQYVCLYVCLSARLSQKPHVQTELGGTLFRYVTNHPGRLSLLPSVRR